MGRAAVLPLAVDGGVSESDRAALEDRLAEGLERGSFAIVRGKRLGSIPEGCSTPECYRTVASQAGVGFVVRAKVGVVDRDYTVRVELMDGGSGKSLAATQEGCEICGIADVEALMTTAAATLRTKLDALAKGPSTLVVASTPSEATVLIDGEIVGETPLERPVMPGKRLLRVSKEGFITIERQVEVVEGVHESLAFTLEKVPNRLPSRPWGWVSLSFGLASVATAVTFGVLDGINAPYKLFGKCSGSNRDADGDCARIWDAEWIVLPTALAGAALTTLGAAILIQTADRKRSTKRNRNGKAQTRVGVGLGRITVQGRF